MPKMKTHKGTAKRYRKTGSGSGSGPKAWRGHHLEIKSSRRTRRYAGVATVSKTHHDALEVLMPYAGKGK
jgi:large subunit ribosomal protein L35